MQIIINIKIKNEKKNCKKVRKNYLYWALVGVRRGVGGGAPGLRGVEASPKKVRKG
jgi:hypothetical protein